MIPPEVIARFDWSEVERRVHYGRLQNVYFQTVDLIAKIRKAQDKDGYFDIGVRDKRGEFWLGITRPGMPDGRPDFPRRDLALIEYLVEWAAGVRNHAIAEMEEMDSRYPELARLAGWELMAAEMVYRKVPGQNWLKRALKSIFG